jgi:hypothetical protein
VPVTETLPVIGWPMGTVVGVREKLVADVAPGTVSVANPEIVPPQVSA